MPDRNMELKLILSGDGRVLQSSLRKNERDIKGFTSRAGKMYSGLRTRMNTGLKRMIINPLTGLAAGAGVMMLGKQLIDFDSKLMRVGIQGNLSSKQMTKLREAIVETGIATGQSREEILAGIDAIVERTGNIEFASKIKHDMAIASTATGAAMADMGALASNLNQKFGILDTQIMEAFDTLTIQGKAGAFTLQNMASMGERLFAAAGRLGLKDLGALREFGALMQVARMGTGSSEQATTSIERILANIIDKQDQIRKLGFNVFTGQLDKEGNKQFKSLPEILKGVITAAKGDEKILGRIFGEEGIRGVSTLARVWRETRGFDIYDKLVNADADRAGEIMRDFARYSTTASFKLSVMREIGKKFADKALSKPIDEMTKSLNALLNNPERLKEFEQAFEDIGTVVATVAKGLALSASGWGKIISLTKTASTTFSHRMALGEQWKALPKAERKSLEEQFGIKRRENRGRYWELIERALNRQPQVVNNITINQDAEGRVVGVKSDSLSTKNSVSVNRGAHRARQ